jgi:RimJ/RimL family protein N-acetyltransferase
VGVGLYRGVELDSVRLDGPRLTLRGWRRTDADRVAEIMADRSMNEFLALPDPYTSADARQFVREVGIRGRAEGRALHSAVVERSSGRLIGSATLHLHTDPEIGYWIAPEARGAGYAAEAAELLAGWAFGVGVRRLRVLCDVRNLASARTALAAGFRFEGIARDGLSGGGTGAVPERRADLAMFARLPADPGGRVAPAFPDLPPAGLSDGVLRLRTIRPDDAPGLAETDDEVTLRWSFTGQPQSDVARTAAQAGLDWLVGAIARFAMVDVATGRVAGSVDLRKAGPPQVGGIGYVVHPAFRGRGYTSRALRLLVPWAFEVADFARLELGAKQDNAASLRAAANAGFEPDGVRERRMRNPDGTFTDETRYALINPKYR